MTAQKLWIPSIDLYDGSCVRLVQGKREALQTYGDDPLSLAKSYVNEGASRLHIVDLKGAFEGTRHDHGLIKEICKIPGVDVQVGGGVRSLEDLQGLLESGAKRVALGSLAVLEPERVLEWIEELGSQSFTICLDLKVNEKGSLWPLSHGWTKFSDLSFDDLAGKYTQFEGLEFLCTDISRDGCLAGIEFGFYESLGKIIPLDKVIVSGGVSQLSDLTQIQASDLKGAVIGKALHEGRLSMKDLYPC